MRVCVGCVGGWTLNGVLENGERKDYKKEKLRGILPPLTLLITVRQRHTNNNKSERKYYLTSAFIIRPEEHESKQHGDKTVTRAFILDN